MVKINLNLYFIKYLFKLLLFRLGILVGSRLYFRFSDENAWEEKMTNLINELKKQGIFPQSDPLISLSTSNPFSPISLLSPSIQNSPKNPFPQVTTKNQPEPANTKNMINWKGKEVGEWLKKCGLEDLIPIFDEYKFFGGSIMELHFTLINHRQEYFLLLKEMGVTIGLTLQLATHLRLLQL